MDETKKLRDDKLKNFNLQKMHNEKNMSIKN